jgi:hypothetical protein
MRSSSASFLIVFLAFLAGCRGTCSNDGQSQQLSPSGEWKYVVFSRNCGATTGENYQLSVLRAKEQLPSDAANVFIADNHHGKTDWIAQPEWVSENRLRIAYSANARVFKKEAKAGSVQIEYAER